MARSKSRRKTRRQKKSSDGQFGYLLLGMAAGIGIAAAFWYLSGTPQPPASGAESTSLSTAGTTPAKSATKPAERANTLDATGSNYDFYDMLPEQEIIVRDDFAGARSKTVPRASEPVEEPGVYRIQAGAFSSTADADRMKAELGLLGMRADVVPVDINNRRLYRVVIGPIEELAELNEFQRRLGNAGIDIAVSRIRE